MDIAPVILVDAGMDWHTARRRRATRPSCWAMTRPVAIRSSSEELAGSSIKQRDVLDLLANLYEGTHNEPGC